MSPHPPQPQANGPVAQQAATWVIRIERGLTAAEQDEFVQWLTQDRSHGPELARQRRNWRRLDRLADWKPEHSPRPNRDLLAPPPKSRITLLLDRRPPWWPLLLAAALMVGFFLWSALPLSPRATPTPATPIATIVERTLDDGSVVTLNRGAKITVDYTSAMRRVHLERGEAHFSVAKNPERPFAVTAGTVTVRAVGTAFNVRLADEAVDVLVTEGKVQVLPAAGAGADPGVEPVPLAVLETGERTRVHLTEPPVTPRVAPVTPSESQALLAWQPRMLDFTATPLSRVVEDFNHHNAPIRLLIADSVLAGTKVSASLRSDNVEGFIRLIEAGFAVKAEREGDTITLRQAQ